MGREDNKQKLVGRLCYVPDNVKIGGVGTVTKKTSSRFFVPDSTGSQFSRLEEEVYIEKKRFSLFFLYGLFFYFNLSFVFQCEKTNLE